jgi:hypothetical protein
MLLVAMGNGMAPGDHAPLDAHARLLQEAS